MLHLVIQRILHKKWMIACLIIGNILLTAVAVTHPLYNSSSSQSMLIEEFDSSMKENNKYPMMIHTIGRIRKNAGRSATNKIRKVANGMSETIGLPIVEQICYRNMISSTVTSMTVHDGMFSKLMLALSSLSDLEKHCEVLSGRMYSDKVTDDGFIEVMINQSVMVEHDLIVGEELTIESIKGPDKKPVNLRVVGVYTNSSDEDLYWYNPPSFYSKDLMMDHDLFEELFMYEDAKKNQFDEEFIILPDYKAITPDTVDDLIYTTNDLVKNNNDVYRLLETSNYLKLLEQFRTKQKQIDVMLTILEVPVALMLLAFIFMISRQMLSLEEGEVAMLKSRGASAFQIFRLYLMQSLVVSGVGLILGFPIGAGITKLLGRADAFLSFSGGRKMDIIFKIDTLYFALGAMVLSVLITMIPVMKKDKTSIVAVKRRRNRQTKPLWMKLYLDIIITGISIYGYYTFLNSKDEMIMRVLSGKAPDPLVFLSAALFILGSALLCVRIHRFLLKVVYRVGKKKWKPVAYTSLLELIRSGNKQVFVMVFLILTVSFGLFYTTIARTIVANSERNLKYIEGADIKVREYWMNNSRLGKGHYYEPDFAKYGQLEGADAARVYIDKNATFFVESRRFETEVMGINTNEFGKAAPIDESLLAHDYYDYLNVLSRNPNAVLVSSAFKDRYLFKIGDEIMINLSSPTGNHSVICVIYGFFDYWPSYRPTQISIGNDGKPNTAQKMLVVANLSKIQSTVGVLPYDVWINTDGDNEKFYELAETQGFSITSLTDSVKLTEALHDDPLFAGTSGILTMSFIAILVICSIGYLMYWSLSIRARQLQFGVFRAMGVTAGQVSGMLIIEQILTGVYCIIVGLISGYLASILFVPMIQIAYQGADNVLAMKLITKPSDVIELVAVILAVFIICVAVLMRQIKSMKISQALKLGED
ncbi:MAG: FtsX-like permease family protein [Lachnospiraceae bacterium]|nr:FtsX-like permease family protein [Lachnospiraceae bacterium]